MSKLSLTGVYCYETTKDGDLKLYVVPPDVKNDYPTEVTIERNDLMRLHCSIADAMMKQVSRR